MSRAPHGRTSSVIGRLRLRRPGADARARRGGRRTCRAAAGPAAGSRRPRPGRCASTAAVADGGDRGAEQRASALTLPRPGRALALMRRRTGRRDRREGDDDLLADRRDRWCRRQFLFFAAFARTEPPGFEIQPTAGRGRRPRPHRDAGQRLRRLQRAGDAGRARRRGRSGPFCATRPTRAASGLRSENAISSSRARRRRPRLLGGSGALEAAGMPTPPPVATNREPSSTPSSDQTRTMPPLPPAPAVSCGPEPSPPVVDALQGADAAGDDVDAAAATARAEGAPAPGSARGCRRRSTPGRARACRRPSAEGDLPAVPPTKPGSPGPVARERWCAVVCTVPTTVRSPVESSWTGPPLLPRLPAVAACRRAPGGVDVGGRDVSMVPPPSPSPRPLAGAAAEAERAGIEAARQRARRRAAAPAAAGWQRRPCRSPPSP